MVSQCQVLNKVLQTKDFSLVSMNNLDDKFFFNYKLEFNYIKNHYETYHCIPDKLTFGTVFPDFDFVDVTEPDTFLLEQLYKDYNSSYLASKFTDIKKMLEADKTDDAVNYFLKSVENIHNGAALTCTSLITDTSRFDRYEDRIRNKDQYYISTGFAELDKITGGISRDEENFVIAARTGQGKTFCMLKMAVAAFEQGLVVGIYEGEMSTDKIGYRIDTLRGHINNKEIMRGDPAAHASYRDYIDSLAAIAPGHDHKGDIKIITPNDIAGPATVNALQAFVEKEHIDILFIDQYSLLEDTSHAKTTFERVGNIAIDIKHLQVNKRIPIISVAQMNRTKTDNGEQDTTQIGLSDLIPQYATNLLMLDRKDDRLIMTLTKGRDGGTNKKLTYAIDWNIGKFEFIPEEGDNVTSAENFNQLADSFTPTSATVPVGGNPFNE